MENFGKVMAGLIALILSPILNGFVVVKMWGWFIVTTFNAEPLRIVEAIGLVYIIGFITYEHTKDDNDTESPVLHAILVTVFKALFFLFAGWVVSKFM